MQNSPPESKLKILVVYHSQSGQLYNVLRNIVKDIELHVDIDFYAIELEHPFPFPWQAYSFFDAMPESVLQIPAPLKDMPETGKKDYDAVILGYQPWFLSPSIPVNSFLKSRWASVMEGKPVITVIGCRNMWLNAQEIVKADLKRLGAIHVGNIVLEDRHSNIISTLTIIRWLFKGKKERSGLLPDAGISEEHILAARRFGPPILEYLTQKKTSRLQKQLIDLNAIYLKPELIILEKRGVGQFPKWARKAKSKGEPGNKERAVIIKRFQYLLIIAIFILSPVTYLVAKIQTALKIKKLMREVTYFKGIEYIPGKLQ